MLTLVGCGSPSVSVLTHDEDQAAVGAEEFAKVAFVQHDYQKAYSYLWDETKKHLSLEQVTEIIKTTHTSGYPSQVFAAEFEPMPGQTAMNIFLRGKNEKEEFFYRLVMEGTKEKGYKVSGFYRGSGPYPPSKLRMALKGKDKGSNK
jgi:hypothetical protein